jgi:hypothetical protein
MIKDSSEISNLKPEGFYMPTPSTVKTLPKDDREWLEKQLLERNFADYDGLVQALAQRGLEISRSAVARFGKEFKDYVEKIRRSTDMAMFLANEAGDDTNAIGDATIRMVQAEVFEALQNYDFSTLQDAKPHLLIRAIADLNRATVGQKKWMEEAKESMAKAKQELEALVGDKRAGLSAEALQRIENAAKLL